MPAVFKEMTKSSSCLSTVADDIHYNAFQYQHDLKLPVRSIVTLKLFLTTFIMSIKILCVLHKEHNLCNLVFQVVSEDFPQHIRKRKKIIFLKKMYHEIRDYSSISALYRPVLGSN